MRITVAHTSAGGAYELELRGGARIKTGRRYRVKIRNGHSVHKFTIMTKDELPIEDRKLNTNG